GGGRQERRPAGQRQRHARGEAAAARARGGGRLNAELEAKTEKLVRQAEEVMVSTLCRLLHNLALVHMHTGSSFKRNYLDHDN
uniref:Uncharacterized protein n=1 Tax=Anas platyrhynchos platyrhynchos TaxID=8840 RepID=A0A493SX66_ANAPP